MKKYNVLLANSDVSQLENYCNYLSAKPNLHITSIDTGIDALNAYKKLNPNIFIIDTNFKDVSCSEIIDKISITRKECQNSNVILTTYASDFYPISNVEKIYKILYKNFNFDMLGNAVRDICLNHKYLELNETDIKLMLNSLEFNVNSGCTKYLIEAIIQCYYYPYLLNNLDNVAKVISYQFDVPEDTVKYAFRNSLRPINTYRNSIKGSTLMNLFDETRNITPKYFLDVITTYLHKQNQASENRNHVIKMHDFLFFVLIYTYYKVLIMKFYFRIDNIFDKMVI